MNRIDLFGFPIDDLPNYPESNVALVDALRDYILRLERDADDYETDALAAGEPKNEKEERRFNRHLQAAKLLLKEIENDEVNPSLNGTIQVRR
jgi:CCR4-NOT transcriptional regulation complex NOT5 subunit